MDDDHGDQEHSTHGFPPMEAPSPSFIANTWDNIIVPSDIDEATSLTHGITLLEIVFSKDNFHVF